MRFYLLGPKVFGLRPGIGLSGRELKNLVSGNQGHWRGGFVYVVQNGDGRHCKIGITSNPVARLAQLQTGSAHPLRFAFLAAAATEAREIEAAAHGFLARCRRAGEWFECEAAAAIGAIYFAAGSTRQPIIAIDHTSPEDAPALAAQAFAAAARGRPLGSIAILTMLIGIIALYCAELGIGAGVYAGLLTIWVAGVSMLWKWF